jgi:hypothetical protein
LTLIEGDIVRLPPNIQINLTQLAFDSDSSIRGKTERILIDNYQKFNDEVKSSEKYRTWLTIKQLYRKSKDSLKNKNSEKIDRKTLGAAPSKEIPSFLEERLLTYEVINELNEYYGNYDIFYLINAHPDTNLDTIILSRMINMDFKNIKLLFNVENKVHLSYIVRLIVKNYDKIPLDHKRMLFSSSIKVSDVISKYFYENIKKNK